MSIKGTCSNNNN